MKILVDTHIVLWSLTGDSKLPLEAIRFLESPANELFFSVASIWEVAIKHMLHPDKMIMSGADLTEKASLAGFELLHLKGV